MARKTMSTAVNKLAPGNTVHEKKTAGSLSKIDREC